MLYKRKKIRRLLKLFLTSFFSLMIVLGIASSYIKNNTNITTLNKNALKNKISTQYYTLKQKYYLLQEKQKEIMIAIAKEQKAKGVTSAAFIKKYRLTSASSVQSGLKGLLEKDMLTQESGGYQVYDRLFNIWLRRNY